MVLPLIEAIAVISIVLTATRMMGLDPGTAAGLAAGAATESAVVGTAAEALKHLGLGAGGNHADGIEHRAPRTR